MKSARTKEVEKKIRELEEDWSNYYATKRETAALTGELKARAEKALAEDARELVERGKALQKERDLLFTLR